MVKLCGGSLMPQRLLRWWCFPAGSPWGLFTCWLDTVATALSHGTLLWSCVNQAAGSESTADLWGLNQQQPGYRNKLTAQALNHCGDMNVDALVFISHLWSGLAPNQSNPHICNLRGGFRLLFQFRQWACNRPFNIQRLHLLPQTCFFFSDCLSLILASCPILSCALIFSDCLQH